MYQPGSGSRHPIFDRPEKSVRRFYKAAITAAFCCAFANVSQAQPKTEPNPEVESDQKRDTGWPDRLGPAEIETKVGSVRLAFSAQLLVSELNKDTGDDRDNAFEVEPRRIRWNLKGRFFDDRLKLVVQINTTPKSLELLDYWGDWRFFEQLQMRLGQFKEPFTRYRQQSFSSSLLVDWANVTSYFGADRQLGIMLHNRDAKPRFEYALAIYSGQNLRKSQAVAAANTVYGEKIPSASFLPRDSSLSVDEWHPEIELRVQHNSPHAEPYYPSDDERTGLRHVESLSVTWDNVANLHTVGGRDVDRTVDREATRDLLLRASPEVMLKAYGIAFILDGYLGVARMTQSSHSELAILGIAVEAAYRFDRFWEVAARFSRVDFTEAFRQDAIDRSSVITDSADADAEAEIENQYLNAGQTKADQEITLGYNVYFVGNDLKWQTDASWLRKNRVRDDRDDFRVRTQMQIAF